jgi:hypothetical protein
MHEGARATHNKGNWQEGDLPDGQHFANIIAAEEELNRREIAEQILNVPVVKHALQPKA